MEGSELCSLVSPPLRCLLLRSSCFALLPPTPLLQSPKSFSAPGAPSISWPPPVSPGISPHPPALLAPIAHLRIPCPPHLGYATKCLGASHEHNGLPLLPIILPCVQHTQARQLQRQPDDERILDAPLGPRHASAKVGDLRAAGKDSMGLIGDRCRAQQSKVNQGFNRVEGVYGACKKRGREGGGGRGGVDSLRPPARTV